MSADTHVLACVQARDLSQFDHVQKELSLDAELKAQQEADPMHSIKSMSQDTMRAMGKLNTTDAQKAGAASFLTYCVMLSPSDIGQYWNTMRVMEKVAPLISTKTAAAAFAWYSMLYICSHNTH